MPIIERYAPHPRFLDLNQELAAACDPDFDTQDEALEREFAELRLQLASIE